MQKGKIYKHGAWWMFRYKEPVIEGDRKVWRDKYVKLAPADQYRSAAAVEKDGLVSPYRRTLDASTSTPSATQPVVNFIGQVYFAKAEKSLKASTVFGYRHLFNRHVKPQLNGQRMCDFKLPSAQKLMDAISSAVELSTTSLKHIKWFLVAVFDAAKLEGAYSDVNPFRETVVPKGRKSKPTRYATVDQIFQMLEALPEPAKTVVAAAAFSGLRKSELQGLRWEDLQDGQLHVQRAAWRTTKIDEVKTVASKDAVPVIPLLAAYLENHRDGFPADGFVFAGPKKPTVPLDLHNLANRVIRPVLAARNIPWCGYHGFRRGLATALHTVGVSDTDIQHIMRHADVSVTQKSYIKADDGTRRAAMARLQAVLGVKNAERIGKARRDPKNPRSKSR